MLSVLAGSLFSGPVCADTLRFVSTREPVDAVALSERLSVIPSRDRAFEAIRDEGGRVSSAIRDIVAPLDPEAREIWAARGVSARLSDAEVDQLSSDWPSLKFETIESVAMPVSDASPEMTQLRAAPAWNQVMCGAWDLARLRNLSGKGVMISVVGPAVPFDHLSIADRIIAQRVFDPGTPTEPARGTEDLMLLHPLGILAGRYTDPAKSLGAAPEATIALATIPRGKIAADDLLAAIQWALEPIPGKRPAAILFAVDFQTTAPRAIRDALAACRMAGVLAILPAGNNPSRITGMAALPEVLTIGALDQWRARAAFSGCGPSVVDGYPVNKPDYMEPGLAVTGPASGNTYKQGSGTLQAAAHFAGIWAQVIQSRPDTDIETILSAFSLTARDIGPTGTEPEYGMGLADPLAMLQYLDNPNPPPYPPTYPPASQTYPIP